MTGQDTHHLALEGALPLKKNSAGQWKYFEAPCQTSALAFALNTSVDLAVEYSAHSFAQQQASSTLRKTPLE